MKINNSSQGNGYNVQDIYHKWTQCFLDIILAGIEEYMAKQSWSVMNRFLYTYGLGYGQNSKQLCWPFVYQLDLAVINVHHKLTLSLCALVSFTWCTKGCGYSGVAE